MGVPGFFAWLLKYKSNNIILEKLDVNIDCLYIDANCLFHPKCFEILKLYPNEKNIQKLESLMIKNILEYIDFLIKITRPTRLIYIAVDGVAPIAKIDQQRKRRYKSYYENKFRNDLMTKYSIPHNELWSNVVITPGTQFMEKLHNALNKHIKTHPNKAIILYSSYKEEGEGEHKIYSYMKKKFISNKYVHIIYGLDADLIFLSLASNFSSLYLLREGEEFGKNNIQFNYVDIEQTKVTINQIMNDRLEHINEDDGVKKTNNYHNYHNDFIILCYFLGNDFIPHLPSIDIKKDGMDILLNAYSDMMLYTNEKILDDEYNLNLTSFKIFIKSLANIEDELLKIKLYEHLKREERFRCQSKEKFDIEIFNYENLKYIEKSDPFMYFNELISFEESKFKYYEHYLHVSVDQDIMIEKMVKSYFEIFSWVIDYYFKGCKNWRQKYEFNVAPFITDIYRFFDRINFTEINDKIKQVLEPFTINQQLISVIPITYKKIIPKNLQQYYYNNELIEMFPRTFKLDYNYKTRRYLCEPELPWLNQEKIRQIIV
jgi:5'-3' exonuclease